MKKLFLLLFCAMSTMFAAAQANLQDVVYLKNGSVVRGTIIEQVPGVSLKLQTNDGNIFVYNIEDVEKMTKEQSKTATRQVSTYAYSNGAGSTNSTAMSERSPFVAGLLSWIVPGAGQFYNGQSKKGWGDLGLHLGSSIIMGIGTGLMSSSYSYDYYDGDYYYYDESQYTTGCIFMVVGGVTLFVNGICSIVDAVKSAKNINVEKGFVMYSFNENCAFGIQPAVTYEKPQYMLGSKAELAAGMNFKLTF
ncbi:MAG: hypothetical protein E7091_02465 [Bacteroidales bacterium]|nr:hypothetical protein [Bacteroidales bacterium]